MIRKILLLALVWLISLNKSFAVINNNPATVKLYLEYIKIDSSYNNTSTKHKNRLYIQVTEYSDIKHSQEYRIPMYPKHWLIKDLSKLKNILLWKNNIDFCENKKIIISLIDQAFPPLDNDQSLGSVKLILHNKKSRRLQVTWDAAGFKEDVQIKKIFNKKSPNTITFSMQSKQGSYLLKFYMINKK